MKDFLEDLDVATLVCLFLRVKEILNVRATCKAGRTNTVDAFCPKKAWKRVLQMGDRSCIKQCRRKDTLMRIFARDGQFDLLQWARTGHRPAYWTCMVTAEAASKGDIEMLKWLCYEANPPLARGDISRIVVLGGLEHSTRGIECASAARGGHLATLQWLRAQDPPFPWTKLTFENAASEGHLHILKWVTSISSGLTCPCPCSKGRLVEILISKIRFASQDKMWLLEKHMPTIEWVYPMLNSREQHRVCSELAELNIVLE